MIANFSNFLNALFFSINNILYWKVAFKKYSNPITKKKKSIYTDAQNLDGFVAMSKQHNSQMDLNHIGYNK